MTLWVHVVEVEPNEVIRSKNPFFEEYMTRRALRPVAIVPIRFRDSRKVDLSKVSAAVKRAKTRRKEREDRG